MSRSSVTGRVAAAPETVFAALVDPARLPDWNAAIRHVVQAPPALAEGDEWVVALKVLGRSWASRSRVLELDPAAGVFRYRSQTDDGNPSYAEWAWTVRSDGAGGSLVEVSWQLVPKTFWRRSLLVRVRRNLLVGKEVPHSLQALARMVEAALVDA